MPSRLPSKPRSDPLSKRSGSEAPVCPECQRRMTVKQVTPVLFASDIDDVVYGCERCGTQAKRSVNRA